MSASPELSQTYLLGNYYFVFVTDFDIASINTRKCVLFTMSIAKKDMNNSRRCSPLITVMRSTDAWQFNQVGRYRTSIRIRASSWCFDPNNNLTVFIFAAYIQFHVCQNHDTVDSWISLIPFCCQVR